MFSSRSPLRIERRSSLRSRATRGDHDQGFDGDHERTARAWHKSSASVSVDRSTSSQGRKEMLDLRAARGRSRRGDRKRRNRSSSSVSMGRLSRWCSPSSASWVRDTLGNVGREHGTDKHSPRDAKVMAFDFLFIEHLQQRSLPGLPAKRYSLFLSLVLDTLLEDCELGATRSSLTRRLNSSPVCVLACLKTYQSPDGSLFW